MSIEMNNPKTVYEKIDAAANMVEQIMLAHTIKDEAHFKVVHKKAVDFLFDAMRKIENEGDQNAWVNGWISVEDRLPVTDDNVLVSWLGTICLAAYDDGRWGDDEGTSGDGYVTHWMPLPEPPKP